jgi:F-type H+-transporting ATPase subunit b
MRIFLPLALVLFLIAVCAAPALASDAEADGKAKLDLAAQLNWVSIVTSIAVFVILLLVLSKVAWKPILEGLQKREDTIKKALDDAAEANEQARALIAKYEAKLDQAREEGQAILEETRKDAQDLRAQIEADANKRATETVERSKREVEQVFAKAWDELVKDAATVATQAASQIIQQQLSPEGHAKIVSNIVSDLERRTRAARSGGNDA